MDEMLQDVNEMKDVSEKIDENESVSLKQMVIKNPRRSSQASQEQEDNRASEISLKSDILIHQKDESMGEIDDDDEHRPYVLTNTRNVEV